MSGQCAIRVRDVKKAYKIYFDKGSTFKERFINRKRSYFAERLVLDGISFEIKKGEAVGLIGGNGCGKSTTLKLLTKIIFPDDGTVEINGRVSSLLELGAGFHPDMSGRENIYTNASIFGLSKREIDDKLDKIIEFSELEEFIDNPVRTYSSGMYMRLAFSVAINVDADILLLDEILAVGDVNFQKKCVEKIQEIKDAGATIVIVSHSRGQIESICDRVIWIESGKVRESGEPKEINQKYQDEMEARRLQKVRDAQKKEDISVDVLFNKLTLRSGNGVATFVDVWIEDLAGERQDIFSVGNDFIIRMKYKSVCKLENVIISFSITRLDGVLCFATNNCLGSGEGSCLNFEGEIGVYIKACSLLAGKYMLNVAMTSQQGEVYDDLQRVLFFEINAENAEQGICNILYEWL